MNTQRFVLKSFISATVIMMLLGCSSSESAKTSPQETMNTSIAPSPPIEITETVESVDIVEGKRVLYIGHSFGRPFARELPSFVEMAGIDNHVQEIVLGGPNGSPQSLWEDPKVRVEIQDILAEGDTDLLIMICCSENFLESRKAIGLWRIGLIMH